jgi:hypothetical protein
MLQQLSGKMVKFELIMEWSINYGTLSFHEGVTINGSEEHDTTPMDIEEGPLHR